MPVCSNRRACQEQCQTRWAQCHLKLPTCKWPHVSAVPSAIPVNSRSVPSLHLTLSESSQETTTLVNNSSVLLSEYHSWPMSSWCAAEPSGGDKSSHTSSARTHQSKFSSHAMRPQ
eukprot:2559898-Amphidinium_carterae.1